MRTIAQVALIAVVTMATAGFLPGQARAAQEAVKNTKRLAVRIRFIRAGTRTPTAVSDNGAGHWFNPKARKSSRAERT